jgi:hypothetical protein
MKYISVLALLIISAHATAATKSARAPEPNTKAASVSKSRIKAPAKAALAAPTPLEDASEEQLAAAERAYLGQYDCEFKQSVHITHHPKPGYINVAWEREVFTMKPVLSSTGALRLEDVTGRTLMIQIANKSMLLDTKAGRRLVDECLHPEQRAAIEATKMARAAAAAAAAASGVELAPEPTSLGIAPNKPGG